MKKRISNGENITCNVYIYEDRKAEQFIISIPDLFWAIEFNYDLFGESLTEHLFLHLFNIMDESDAEELAMRITQWTSET